MKTYLLKIKNQVSTHMDQKINKINNHKNHCHNSIILIIIALPYPYLTINKEAGL